MNYIIVDDMRNVQEGQASPQLITLYVYRFMGTRNLFLCIFMLLSIQTSEQPHPLATVSHQIVSQIAKLVPII